MPALTDAAGFVLVGGRSSRMGADKATLPFRGVPLARFVADQISPVVDQVFLVGDSAAQGGIGIAVVADEFPGAGPLGGIVSALRATSSTWNIVSACDLPRVQSEIFRQMLRRIQQNDAQCVVPVTPDGRQQVLCAVYRKDALEPLSSALEDGERRLRTAIGQLDADFWPVDSADWSANVNTPGEWAVYASQSEAS